MDVSNSLFRELSRSYTSLNAAICRPESCPRYRIKVESVLKRLRSYQTGDGAFAYWPGQSSTSGWGSVYAGHFMLEAEKQGYAVSSSMKKSWLTNQLQMAQQWKPVNGLNNQGEALTQAYRFVCPVVGNKARR